MGTARAVLLDPNESLAIHSLHSLRSVSSRLVLTTWPTWAVAWCFAAAPFLYNPQVPSYTTTILLYYYTIILLYYYTTIFLYSYTTILLF